MSGFSYADAFAALVPGEDVAVRFWAKVDVRGADECWPWTAGGYRTGYGAIKVDGAMRSAHRVAWELHHGLFMAAEHARHVCDYPPCCNPAHILPGTNQDNVHDMHERGRNRNQNTDKTHCPRGHPLAGANLLRHSGRRYCLACRTMYDCRRRHEPDCQHCPARAESLAKEAEAYLDHAGQ
jgi:hypothetical protein